MKKKPIKEQPKPQQATDVMRQEVDPKLREGFTTARMTKNRCMIPDSAHTNQTVAHPGRKKNWKNPAKR